MPIHAGNEGQDTLGDLIKNQPAAYHVGGGYDPARWQNEARGQGKNRVLAHQDEGLVIEQIEPQPPVPRMIDLPETDAEAVPLLNQFFEDNADLKPHAQAVIAEVKSIQTNAPGYGRSDTFNLAVKRVCEANNLPLEREAPLPAPLNPPTLNDEVKRLEAEAQKVRTQVGQDFAPIREAMIAMAPTPKRRK